MNLQFKFRADASPTERTDVVAHLEGKGADVEKVFPDEADDDLGALYSAHVQDNHRFAALLRWLKRVQVVDYAEPEADRAIYLPQEMITAPARSRTHRRR
jgi:hypothetical protein